MTATDDDLGHRLDAFKRECVALRMGAQLPGAHAAPQEVLDCLLDVRQRLDRVEQLLGDAMRLRSVARTHHIATRITVDDAWDAAAVRLRSAAVRDEYSSAGERTAATNLEVLDARRVERLSGEQARLCDETVEFLRLRHRGLTDIRQEVLALLRHHQFESTLDR